MRRDARDVSVQQTSSDQIRVSVRGQIRLVLLTVGALVSVTPIAWMVISSLRFESAGYSDVFTLSTYTLDNYRLMFERVPIARFTLNSVFIAGSIIALQLFVNVPAAYALSRFEFKGRSFLKWAALATMMVPIQATILPVYVLFSKMGLTNSYTSVVLPFAASGFGIFLFYQFFRGVPTSIIDAARVDGLSEWRIAWTMVVPIAKPAIIAFGIFSAVTHWNSFFWPLMMLSGLSKAPLTFGIAWFSDAEAGTNWNGQMALATVAVMPLLLGFILAQKRFVEGIAMSGIKG